MIETLLKIWPIIWPFLAALLAVGGPLTTYLVLRGQKPKTDAEADETKSKSKKINADIVVTFAEGWEKIAKDFERRLKEMEYKFDAKEKKHAEDIERLQEQIDTYRSIIQEKDKRIDSLEGRIDELETELSKYQGVQNKAEEVRDTLHHNVDDSINKITDETI